MEEEGVQFRIQNMMDNLGEEWSSITSCSVLLQCALMF